MWFKVTYKKVQVCTEIIDADVDFTDDDPVSVHNAKVLAVKRALNEIHRINPEEELPNTVITVHYFETVGKKQNET